MNAVIPILLTQLHIGGRVIRKVLCPRQQRYQLLFTGILPQLGQLLEQGQQMTEGIQTVAFDHFHHANTQGAGIGSFCGITEQRRESTII